MFMYIQVFAYETGFHGAQNRSNSPRNYDPEGLILLSPPLESSDDGRALPQLGLGSHEQFFIKSSYWRGAMYSIDSMSLMPIVFHVITVPFCFCCGRGSTTPLSSRTELPLTLPFSVYLLVSESLPQSGGASPFVELSMKATCTIVRLGCCTGAMSAMGMGAYFLKQRGLGLHRLGRMKTFAFRTTKDAATENSTDVSALTPQSPYSPSATTATAQIRQNVLKV